MLPILIIFFIFNFSPVSGISFAKKAYLEKLYDPVTDQYVFGHIGELSVRIEGKPWQNCTSFHIDFYNDQNDIILHMKPWYSRSYIAFNNLISGKWGEELRAEVPLRNDGFVVTINPATIKRPPNGFFINFNQMRIGEPWQHLGYHFRVRAEQRNRPLNPTRIEIGGQIELAKVNGIE